MNDEEYNPGIDPYADDDDDDPGWFVWVVLWVIVAACTLTGMVTGSWRRQ